MDPDTTSIGRAIALLGASGRIVVLGENRRSPLRTPHERTSFRGDLGLRAASRTLALSERITTVHRFGLFRCAEAPTSAFRLDLRRVGRVVLRAVAVNAPPGRRFTLRLLRAAIGHRVMDVIAPGWMLVGWVEGDPPEMIPTGRIGVATNEQGVLLLGSGPDLIEKVFTDPDEATRLLSVHRELVAAGVTLVQPAQSTESPTRLRFAWAEGNDIEPRSLGLSELADWTERAASALGHVHGRTLDQHATVLTHGDYWLGALIVRGDVIVSIIDWTDAERCGPERDTTMLMHLVDSREDLDEVTRASIRRRARIAYEAAGGPTGAFT